MTYDPSASERLVNLRRIYADRHERDEADWITEAVDDVGSVRVRLLVWADLINWIERKCEGEVGE